MDQRGKQAGCCRPDDVRLGEPLVRDCHGVDFVSSGSAAALGEVDRVLTTHFDTDLATHRTDSVWW